MILKRGMTDDEILNEIENEMRKKEINQTNENTTNTITIARQILENMKEDTEIEFVLQRGIQNDTHPNNYRKLPELQKTEKQTERD